MADLLWQHDNGGVGLWEMNGLSAGEIVMLTPAQVDPVWKMVGSGDLNGDGKPEIVWQHQTGGWLLAWFMNGEAVQQHRVSHAQPGHDTAWQIAAIADVNGDARADLIWQHDSGGAASLVHERHNPHRQCSLSIRRRVAGNDWKIVGAGDINGDLKPDLIWQQSSTGLIGAWLMNGATATSFVLMTPSQVDRAWHIRGVVDLDSDGKTDLIWQHDNGALGAWLMAGTTATSIQPIPPGNVARRLAARRTAVGWSSPFSSGPGPPPGGPPSADAHPPTGTHPVPTPNEVFFTTVAPSMNQIPSSPLAGWRQKTSALPSPFRSPTPARSIRCRAPKTADPQMLPPFMNQNPHTPVAG